MHTRLTKLLSTSISNVSFSSKITQRLFSNVNTQTTKQTRMLSFDELMKQKFQIDSIIRVDHAGEFGAQRIYEGQLAVLKDTPSGPIIQVSSSCMTSGRY